MPPRFCFRALEIGYALLLPAVGFSPSSYGAKRSEVVGVVPAAPFLVGFPAVWDSNGFSIHRF